MAVDEAVARREVGNADEVLQALRLERQNVAAKVRGEVDEALRERQAVDEALREVGKWKHRRIEVNANLHNPKDSHTPAEGGWLVRIRAGRHVNNPGASRKDKNAASVIAVGNGGGTVNHWPGFAETAAAESRRTRTQRGGEPRWRHSSALSKAGPAVDVQGKAERRRGRPG